MLSQPTSLTMSLSSATESTMALCTWTAPHDCRGCTHIAQAHTLHRHTRCTGTRGAQAHTRMITEDSLTSSTFTQHLSPLEYRTTSALGGGATNSTGVSPAPLPGACPCPLHSPVNASRSFCFLASNSRSVRRGRDRVRRGRTGSRGRRGDRGACT